MTAHLMLGALAIGGWAAYAATALEQLRRAARRREANEHEHQADEHVGAELDDLPY